MRNRPILLLSLVVSASLVMSIITKRISAQTLLAGDTKVIDATSP